MLIKLKSQHIYFHQYADYFAAEAIGIVIREI